MQTSVFSSKRIAKTKTKNQHFFFIILNYFNKEIITENITLKWKAEKNPHQS